MTRCSTTLAVLLLLCFAAPLALDATARELLTAMVGVNAAGFLRGQWWTFVTYQFAHGNWSHLLLNLVSLLSVGPEVERVVGVRKFFAIYFLSGILGACVWLAVVWPLDAHLIGASASICGLLGALAALRPREKYILVFLPVALPAWLLISALAATQVAYLLMAGTNGNVAYTAHLAGGVAGFAIAFVLRRR